MGPTDKRPTGTEAPYLEREHPPSAPPISGLSRWLNSAERTWLNSAERHRPWPVAFKTPKKFEKSDPRTCPYSAFRSGGLIGMNPDIGAGNAMPGKLPLTDTSKM